MDSWGGKYGADIDQKKIILTSASPLVNIIQYLPPQNEHFIRDTINNNGISQYVINQLLNFTCSIYAYHAYFLIIRGASWLWSYGSWIYHHQSCEFEPCSWRCVLYVYIMW
jgi:hypothetical protein